MKTFIFQCNRMFKSEDLSFKTWVEISFRMSIRFSAIRLVQSAIWMTNLKVNISKSNFVEKKKQNVILVMYLYFTFEFYIIIFIKITTVKLL